MVPQFTLGVLGGMGPAAAAEFLRLLAVRAPAQIDQEHPRTLLYSDPQIADRSAAILGHGPSPIEALRRGLLTLCQWGAHLLAVPCNTAHYFINSFRHELPVPLVHIVEATIEDAQRSCPDGAWLLATNGTIRSGLYHDEATRRNFCLYEPPQEIQTEACGCLALVKSGNMAGAASSMTDLVLRLQRLRDLPFVGACTELPLAWNYALLPQDGMISSLISLADHCIERLYQQ